VADRLRLLLPVACCGRCGIVGFANEPRTRRSCGGRICWWVRGGLNEAGGLRAAVLFSILYVFLIQKHNGLGKQKMQEKKSVVLEALQALQPLTGGEWWLEPNKDLDGIIIFQRPDLCARVGVTVKKTCAT